MPGWPQPALPATWTGATSRPPLVGRRGEFEALEEVWACVEAGAAQVVLVGGEPGAGKSRLAAEAAAAVHRAGASVLVGSCSPDLGRPYDPLVQPVAELLAACRTGDLVVPETRGATRTVEDQLSFFVGDRSGAPRRTEDVAEVLAVFDAVLATLRAAATERPLVLVLEDLHWAGDSTLRLLRHVTDGLGSSRVLLLGTHRTTPPDRTDMLSAFVADLARRENVRRLDLHGLAVEEVAEYLVAVGAGRAADVRVAASLLRDHTAGNPFALREAWRDLERRGGLVGLGRGTLGVPDSLRSVIAGRLASLPADQRRLVCVGAVVGEVFGVDTVVAAADDPAVTPAVVFAALEAAAAAGLVEPADVPGAYRFAHALARQAVQDELGAFGVAEAHAAVARAIEREVGDSPSRSLRLAHHFSLATGLGLDDRAAHYLERAADAAEAQLALSDAAALLERAAARAGDTAEHDRLLLRAARCLHLAGRVGRARAIDESLATSTDPDVRLRAAVGFEASAWRSGRDGPRAVSLLREALATSPRADEDPLKVRASGALASALTMTGDARASHEQMEHALRLAGQVGDDELLVAVLRTSMWVDLGLEHSHERAERAEVLVRLAKSGGRVAALGAGACIRAQTGYVLGDREALEEGIADLALMAEQSRQPYWGWTLMLLTASVQIMACDFDGARRTIRESQRAESAFEQEEQGRADGPSSLQEFILRRETGRLDVARRTLEAGLGPERPWRPGLVALAHELGMAEHAGPALRDALSQDWTGLRTSAAWPASLSFLGEAAAWLGDREAMERLLPEAERLAGLNLMGSEMLATLGSADLLVALLRAGLGRPGVEERFATALEMDRRVASPLHEATTRAHWAAYLRRTGAPAGRVHEHEAPAREAAERHGLARVARILGPAAPDEPPDGLTGREVEVLGLLAHGASNRDIATRLFISEHTAANHVRSILMKTQSPNRTAAAHYAVRHHLVTSGSDDGRE